MTKPKKASASKPYERPRRQIGLRLPGELLDWLETEAKTDDRNVPYLIKKAVTELRDRTEKRRRSAAAE